MSLGSCVRCPAHARGAPTAPNMRIGPAATTATDRINADFRFKVANVVRSGVHILISEDELTK